MCRFINADILHGYISDSKVVTSAAAGAAAGTIVPGAGNLVGAVVGVVVGVGAYVLTDVIRYDGERTFTEIASDWLGERVNNRFN